MRLVKTGFELHAALQLLYRRHHYHFTTLKKALGLHKRNEQQTLYPENLKWFIIAVTKQYGNNNYRNDYVKPWILRGNRLV